MPEGLTPAATIVPRLAVSMNSNLTIGIPDMMKKTVVALALLATTASAFAADSVDVRVIGTIVPAACTPALTGGGVVDYGTIKADTISATDYTVLPEKQVSFAITCDAPAKVALIASNGRTGSLAGVPETAHGAGRSPVTLFGLSAVGAAGLGMEGTSQVGGYGVRIDSSTVTADGVAVDSLRADRDPGYADSPWVKDSYSGIVYSPNYQRLTTWAATGTTTPVAFTALSGQLGVQAYINKGSELDLSKPVHLDGLTTITLYYM
jgi:type 1 fimbria pilin